MLLFSRKKSLAVLVVLYMYGLTGYSFHMADLEARWNAIGRLRCYSSPSLSGHWCWSWRRHPAVETVRFDGSEPVIQTLELT